MRKFVTQDSKTTHVAVEVSVKGNMCAWNVDGIVIAVFVALHGDLSGRNLNAKNCKTKCGELIHG